MIKGSIEWHLTKAREAARAMKHFRQSADYYADGGRLLKASLELRNSKRSAEKCADHINQAISMGWILGE